MNRVPGFIVLLQALAPTMTSPTFDSLMTVVTGWVFSGSGTITRSILSAGDLATKNSSSDHRLFSAARWSLDAIWLAIFDLVDPWLGEVIMLGTDDTLARKRGLKIDGVRMHHDPLRSTRSHRTYRSRPELAVELLHLLCNHRNLGCFHIVADSACGGQSVLCNLPENCSLTSRLLPTARIYGLPPAPVKGRTGTATDAGRSPPVAC